MTRWLLSNEDWLVKWAKRSIVARVLAKLLLAVAIASAEHDEKNARRAV